MAEATNRRETTYSEADLQRRVEEIVAQREKERLQKDGTAEVVDVVYKAICFLFGNIGHFALIALRVAFLAVTAQSVNAAYRTKSGKSIWDDPELFYIALIPHAVEVAATLLLPFVAQEHHWKDRRNREFFFWKNLGLLLLALVLAILCMATKISNEYGCLCFILHVFCSAVDAIIMFCLCISEIGELLEKPVPRQRIRWFFDTFF